MAVLVDASTILALSSIGELGLLKDLYGKVTIPREVRDEVLVRDGPAKEAIADAIGDWITVRTAPRNGRPPTGLGRGERGLMAMFKKGDILIIDDALARRTALARGLEFTGLLGVIIAAVEEGRITKARGLGILDNLSSSEFHMSVQLYIEVKRRIEDA